MSSPDVAATVRRKPGSASLTAFLLRLHFYIGLFIGPFILVATLSGVLYVLTPQLESQLYAEQLFTDSIGPTRPLAEQIAVARASLNGDATLTAVRPAPAPGSNSRVLFSQPELNDGESLAVFVDPVSLEIKGQLVSYGSSGILPLRIALDYLHRHLMLGEAGRLYSELAASWLWIAALSGVLLWWRSRRANRGPRRRLRRWHSLIGLWIMAGLLFFSATGLTWSKWAGGNIDTLRSRLNWVTPSVSLQLTGPAVAVDEHAGHHGHPAQPAPMPIPINPALFDPVLTTARAAGIDAGLLEIRPAQQTGTAWLVREVDRSWPTQVDSVAVDPQQMRVTSRADFAQFPLVAKLIRWGIDAHMGVLFGLANQLLLAAFGLGLLVMILLGYRMWWRRRPAPGALLLSQAWRRLNPASRIVTLVLALTLGLSLPVMGASLLVFLLVDTLRYRLAASTRLHEPA